MGDPRDVAGILQDISVLYELSLSVGRSPDIEENCENFLRTLMARKSLDYASVWIHDRHLRASDEEGGGGLRLVYANPSFRTTFESMAADHPLVLRLTETPSFSVSHGEEGFDALASVARVQGGTFAFYRLGDLGILSLYCIPRTRPFTALELGKLRHVVEQFAMSLAGCVDHARVRSAEARRRELEQQMLHAQKLESLGLLAGGIAHDFNNLLTAIIGNMELARPAVSSTKAREHIDNAVAASTRASELCAQLLAYAGRGQFWIRPFDLSEVVREMLLLSSFSVSKKVSIHLDLPEDQMWIEGDRAQLGQVVMNLLTNAAEAIGDSGGTLRASVGRTHLEPGSELGLQFGPERMEGEYIWLEIEDSGVGMPESSLQKLFDPFFTTKFTGRGLGMAAVSGIVRRHRGAIRVRSRVDEGTKVRVLIPAAKTLTPQPPGEPRTALPVKPGACILVVDDEEPVRNILTRILEAQGFEVLCASDGQEALRVQERRPESIDLVLLDLTMPVMDGEEVYNRLAALAPQIPVVLMSGFSKLELDGRFPEPGPVAFLAKPFRRDDVTGVVRHVLGKQHRAADHGVTR